MELSKCKQLETASPSIWAYILSSWGKVVLFSEKPDRALTAFGFESLSCDFQFSKLLAGNRLFELNSEFLSSFFRYFFIGPHFWYKYISHLPFHLHPWNGLRYRHTRQRDGLSFMVWIGGSLLPFRFVSSKFQIRSICSAFRLARSMIKFLKACHEKNGKDYKKKNGDRPCGRN